MQWIFTSLLYKNSINGIDAYYSKVHKLNYRIDDYYMETRYIDAYYSKVDKWNYGIDDYYMETR